MNYNEQNIWLKMALATALLSVATAPAGLAADKSRDKNIGLEKGGDKDLPEGRFCLNGSLAFNIKANFYNLGGFARQTAIGTAGVAGDQFFDDGYNKVEGLGFPDSRTFRWGYGDASQLAGGVANMSSSTSVANVSSLHNGGGEPQPGFDLSYFRPVGKLKRGGHWGIGAGFNYLAINIQDRRGLAGNEDRLTRAFSTAGSTVPPTPTPPYDGEAGGFNPATRILNVSAGADTLTTVIGGAAINGLRELDADLFALKLGPYFEYPLGKRFTVGGGGGFTLAVLDSEYKYNEATAITGMLATPAVAGAAMPTVTGLPASNTQTHIGSGSRSGVLPGLYLDLRLGCEISRQWSAFLGGQFQYLGDFNQSVTDASGTVRGARLELGAAFLVQFGLGYTF
ncbi:MAG: hypothetical protein HZA89_16460 [Verrucomicrobia bacterium]|nr:hypothetical protein [Verrucomicrobiota bacterium]